MGAEVFTLNQNRNVPRLSGVIVAEGPIEIGGVDLNPANNSGHFGSSDGERERAHNLVFENNFEEEQFFLPESAQNSAKEDYLGKIKSRLPKSRRSRKLKRASNTSTGNTKRHSLTPDSKAP